MYEKAFKKMFLSKKNYWKKGIIESLGANKLEIWIDQITFKTLFNLKKCNGNLKEREQKILNQVINKY